MERKHVHVVFRYDDYSARSSTDIELQILHAFRENEASLTFGVIPFVCSGYMRDPSPTPTEIIPLPAIKGSILKRAFEDGTLDIALHGFSHQTINSRELAEFSGLDYNNQEERLAKGKRFLEDMTGAPVTTFVPPWNRYDLDTLLALRQLKFTTLSASRDGEAAEGSNLNYVPFTSDLSQLRDTVTAARASHETQPVIVVLFHQYDFKEIDIERGSITYQDFSDLLSWLKNQEDVRLLSINQLTKVINNFGAYRLILNKRYDSLVALLPSFSKITLYRESPPFLKIILQIAVFYSLVLSLSIAFSFMIGLYVVSRSKLFMNISTCLCLLLTVSLLIYTFHDLKVNYKGMMVSVSTVGISIGLCLLQLFIKKKKFGSSGR